MPIPIYKIMSLEEWSHAQAAGRYAGSADDKRDGFIHLSTAEQLAGTLAKHFAGRDDLLLLAVDPEPLAPHLRWEPARGGAFFPHLYADLPVNVVISVKPMPLGSDGRHRLPDEVS